MLKLFFSIPASIVLRIHFSFNWWFKKRIIEDAHQLSQLYTGQIENRCVFENRYFSADSGAIIKKDITPSSDVDYSDDEPKKLILKCQTCPDKRRLFTVEKRY